MKRNPYIFWTFILLVLVSPLQTLTLPKIETQYLIELPEAFLKTLSTDDSGKASLWHPRLTLTKVHSIQNATDTGLSKKLTSKMAPEFSSFLQLKQSSDDAAQNLVYIPGGADGTSVVKSSKMNCDCRFVKDPNGMSFIQTQQKLQVQDNAVQTATNFIEKQENPIILKNEGDRFSDRDDTTKFYDSNIKETVGVSEEDDDMKILLEKKNQIKKMEEELEEEMKKEQEKKQEEKALLELMEKKKRMKEEQEEAELMDLLEKKKRLKTELEENDIREQLKKEKLQSEDEDLLRLIERNGHQKDRDYESFSSHDLILAELKGQGLKNKKRLQDKYQLLFEDLSDTRNDDDIEGFLEFSQKYQRYKTLLTEQNEKQKNRRWSESLYEEDEDQDLKDYRLLKKIKLISDRSMREELIHSLLSD